MRLLLLQVHEALILILKGLNHLVIIRGTESIESC